MFKRLLLDDATAITAGVAFLTASTIFISMTWRALRMPHRQIDHFKKLPFEPETAAAPHGHDVHS